MDDKPLQLDYNEFDLAKELFIKPKKLITPQKADKGEKISNDHVEKTTESKAQKPDNNFKSQKTIKDKKQSNDLNASTSKRKEIESTPTPPAPPAKKPKPGLYDSQSFAQLTQLVLSMDRKLTQMSEEKEEQICDDQDISDNDMSISEEMVAELLDSPKKGFKKTNNAKLIKGKSKVTNTGTGEESDQDSDLEAILEELDTNKSGPPISSRMAKVLTQIIQSDTNEEKIEELLENYLQPDNLKGLNTPKCNNEIWGKLRIPTRARDIKLQKAQKRISGGLCALTLCLEQLLELKSKDLGLEAKQIVKQALQEGLDSFKMLSSGHAETNFRRREFIKPDLNKRFHGLIKQGTPGSEYLFGDEFSKTVKDLSETNKVGFDVANNYQYGNQSSNYRQSNYNNNYNGGNYNNNSNYTQRGNGRGRYTSGPRRDFHRRPYMGTKFKRAFQKQRK